jgi:hypothetical protein
MWEKQSHFIRRLSVGSLKKSVQPSSAHCGVTGFLRFYLFIIIGINGNHDSTGKYTALSVRSSLIKNNLYVGVSLYKDESPEDVMSGLFNIRNYFWCLWIGFSCAWI